MVAEDFHREEASEEEDRLVAAERQGDGRSNMMMERILRHLTTGSWHLRRALRGHLDARVEEGVRLAEEGTSAEIVVVIEATLDWRAVARGRTARERALEVFSRERVWDTQHNNGILLYLLLADRDAEIIADRGFNEKVTPPEWRDVCAILEKEVATSDLPTAVMKTLDAIGAIARRVFPASASPNELPDTLSIR